MRDLKFMWATINQSISFIFIFQSIINIFFCWEKKLRFLKFGSLIRENSKRSAFNQSKRFQYSKKKKKWKENQTKL